MIPIYIPYIEKYKKSAINAIESNWISNYGVNIKNAEEKLKKILGIKYCILMNNGTSATHMLFIGLKYKYPNIKKIYIPNNVFIAPINCVLKEYEKDKIEVMKLNKETLNIETSEEYIKSLDTNSCVLIVHNLGNIVNVPRLKRIRPDLIFIEDNCEGLFGKYEDKYSGSNLGTLCSAVSFYANKILTTGEGGAFLTNDFELYEYIKSSYSHGMTKERYIHDRLAYNYRMTNIQAGFLYDQLNDLEHILNLKKTIFENYDNYFNELISEKNILKIKNEENTEEAKWMYCIIIEKLNYKKFEKYMNEKLIEIRPFFYDIRKHEHIRNIKIEYNECEIVKNGVMLPCYPGLEIEKQEYIYNCIKEYIKEYITLDNDKN
jgi:dTDP-4-amino-4,6-dideoxygalactose transaminase